MVKGISVKFKSYGETIPAVLKVIKLQDEIKKHNSIVIKASLRNDSSAHTNPEFTEAVLKFCLANKNPEADVFIAEGSEGIETNDLFDSKGYRQLAEKYNIGLIDLNNAEVEEVIDGEFLKFEKISYPKIMKNSFVISLAPLSEDEETEVHGTLSNMLGAFPSAHYRGFFSSKKNKIRKWPIKYSIHDIIKVKMPNLALIDASEKGAILAGQPLEIDKQAAKLLGKEWKSVQHLRLIDESFNKEE